jgi:hypothetical protein
VTPSRPTPYALAILGALQAKAPLFAGVERTVRVPRAVRRRLAHRDAVAARSAFARRTQEVVS